MPPLAHSARKGSGIPAQEYSAHVRGVGQRAAEFATDLVRYWRGDPDLFTGLLRQAAPVHDLGKLDKENQRVLQTSEAKPLPVRHEIAGVMHLLGKAQFGPGVLVGAHHRGLPQLWRWLTRYDEPRDLLDSEADLKAIDRADRFLPEYIDDHRHWCPSPESQESSPVALSVKGLKGLAWRFALSCLVDADHTDTALHYLQEQPPSPPKLEWAARRAALDRYVAGLQKKGRGDAERNSLRQRIYEACRDLDPDKRIYACDSGVGTGKTTAVMAHLLRVAEERKLRHIFVVLPYTNIINQSVSVYREALVLEGEDDAERVVAAHHHQADYGSAFSRQLATVWDCPITVTTAVQFFETMAAAAAPKLRKLHELPGSAIFIDEAHAAIPAKLWPQTWVWLQELTELWGCHVVLASGSLVRFWEHDDFVKPPVSIPDLLPDDVRGDAKQAEQRRVSYRRKTERLTAEGLSRFVESELPGPRLVIVNTIQSAAVIAKRMKELDHDVLHLSTALAPGDREQVMSQIRDRLTDPALSEWTLIATSCVEAGVDFSFRSAARELASTCSMIQVAGRVNRHGGKDSADAPVWVVSLDDAHLKANPAMRTPAKVLQTLFDIGAVDRLDASTLCTNALRRELNESSSGDLRAITEAEEQRNFPEVAKHYRVIDEDSEPVVVGNVLKRLEGGERLSASDLMKGTVRIRAKNLERFGVRPVRGFGDLYAWTLDYDPDFLGYMAGVLNTLSVLAGEFTNA